GKAFAERGAHEGLEGIPRARDPQARSPRDERSENRIGPELSREDRWVGGEIEQGPHARHDRQQRGGLGVPDAHHERSHTFVVSDLDQSGPPALAKRAAGGAGGPPLPPRKHGGPRETTGR